MSDIALPLDGVPAPARTSRLVGDERLAKAAARGSEQAFAALYRRHHQALYRYCRSIVHNEHDAQDALQNAMMRAYAALRTERRDLAVKPWLFRIAHNESVSLLRKRRPEQELGEEREPLGSDVHGTLEARERLSTLVSDLNALPERQRGALVMRELSGLSIEQIAAALGMSSGATKQTLFEARSSLHELAEGRAMQCEDVRRAISQRDGRVLRSRRIRSHLRDCEECESFRCAIFTRSADLAAIAPPLPASVASALLGGILAHGSGHSGGSAAVAATAGSGASLGGHAAVGSLLGKGLAGVAVLAAATAGTVHFTASAPRSSPGLREGGHRTQSRVGVQQVTPSKPGKDRHGGASGGLSVGKLIKPALAAPGASILHARGVGATGLLGVGATGPATGHRGPSPAGAPVGSGRRPTTSNASGGTHGRGTHGATSPRGSHSSPSSHGHRTGTGARSPGGRSRSQTGPRGHRNKPTPPPPRPKPAVGPTGVQGSSAPPQRTTSVPGAPPAKA